MTKKTRLDHLMVSRGLAESGAKAQALILAGRVKVPGHPTPKPGMQLPEDAPVELLEGLKYISRGGEKLEGALKAFGVKPAGRLCLDVGASTGGFTDCLLQNGAEKVFSVDVGTAQLHEKLRKDPRVVSREQTHILKLTREDISRVFPSPTAGWVAVPGGHRLRRDEKAPGPEDRVAEGRVRGEEKSLSLVTVDVSFISLEKILPHLAALTAPGTELLALVKPQFEAGPKEAPKGVVRDPAVREAVLKKISSALPGWGFAKKGECVSPLQGPEGNVEFFLHAVRV